MAERTELRLSWDCFACWSQNWHLIEAAYLVARENEYFFETAVHCPRCKTGPFLLRWCVRLQADLLRSAPSPLSQTTRRTPS